MFELNWIEGIGYASSLFLVLSMIVKNNIKKIRILNLLGCICFVIYGYFINSLPIIIPNFIISCVHVYYLCFAKTEKV